MAPSGNDYSHVKFHVMQFINDPFPSFPLKFAMRSPPLLHCPYIHTAAAVWLHTRSSGGAQRAVVVFYTLAEGFAAAWHALSTCCAQDAVYVRFCSIQILFLLSATLLKI